MAPTPPALGTPRPSHGAPRFHASARSRLEVSSSSALMATIAPPKATAKRASTAADEAAERQEVPAPGDILV